MYSKLYRTLYIVHFNLYMGGGWIYVFFTVFTYNILIYSYLVISRCAEFAIPSICHSTFPLCDLRTEKPRKLCRWVSEWISEWVSEWVSELVSQWVSQSVSESVSQSVSQWASERVLHKHRSFILSDKNEVKVRKLGIDFFFKLRNVT